MSKIKGKAPGKIIIFGEHAVVYNKPGISAAINQTCYSLAEIEEGKGNKVEIISDKYGKASKTREEIEKIYKFIEELRENQRYEEIKNLPKKEPLVPFFAILGKFLEEGNEFKPCTAKISSKVGKNLGSSASVFNAFSIAYAEFLGIKIEKEKLAAYANEGDRVVHVFPSGIDAFTIAYGGFCFYRKDEGVKPLEIKQEIPLLVIDSLEPARTGETVTKIRMLKEKKSKLVNEILEELERITLEGLKGLKSMDLEKIGECMLEYYKKLKTLGISTEKLDKIVRIAIENKAYAKPTGGWGGGICIVLAERERVKKLEEIYKNLGFRVLEVNLGAEGTKIEK